MDRSKVAAHDGKARSAPKVCEEHTFVHPDYEIILGDRQISPTGRLVIARLRPIDSRIGILPEFVLRWHERESKLDVDPETNASEAQISQFKDGTGGYYGHHPVKLPSKFRTFAVDVGWRAEQIYKGQIGFNLGRSVKIETTLTLGPSVNWDSGKGNSRTTD